MNQNPNTYPHPSRRMVQYAQKGMVATSQPLAAQAGLDILKNGGNAIDAAIAAAATLTVVESTSNGIGGDVFALIWIEKERKLHGLNASGKAPMGITLEKMRDAGHDTMPKMGYAPVTVPGAPSAWADLSAKFGNLPLTDTLKPAINYARYGFPISPAVGYFWERAAVAYAKNQGAEFDGWQATFTKNGKAPQIGDIWKLEGHANTLEELSKTNAASFYTGALADEIATHAAKHGGYITKEDLVAHKNSWDAPISVNYRGYDVWEMPPNGQGIAALIALNTLKTWDFTHRDCELSLHRQFEAMKLAFAATKYHVTDPAHMQFDPADLLSETFAEKLRYQITDTAGEPLVHAPTPGGTVYLCAADGEGNMISFIQSNYMGFGSGIVVPGTGIALQNRGADFSLDPTHPNALSGGKKTLHTIIPGFMTKDGQAVGPFGVMGGYMQPQGHLQMVMNTVDFGLNPQASLDAPRWQWMEGKNFTIEHGFPMHIAQGLARRGHNISVALDSGGFGRGQIIWRNSQNGVLIGGCEPRCDSSIACY
ncbi:MAG: gamma-glutamyltransferase family protein [Defluviitaleaceae bacterium]|nr:gamma-glutamyltransferase family protein [Defluviitaleaceae bacterium]